MNLFIYVLLLSFWTNHSFNTNHSNVSSNVSTNATTTTNTTTAATITTTGSKRQSIEIKMDMFRKHLLVIIIGIMIIAFVFTCFCFLHYNCMSDDVPKETMTQNEAIVVGPSKSSLSGSKTTSPYSPRGPEKQSPPSSMGKLHKQSNPEKPFLPSSAEKLIRPSSTEKSFLPSSAEKLIRTPSPEKSSIPSSAEKLIRSSRPEKILRSSNLEKSARRISPKKPHKLKRQASLSYPDKPVRQHWSTNLQYSTRPAKLPCLSPPQNKTFPPKSVSLQKVAKPPRHPNPRRQGNTNRTDMLCRPQGTKPCQTFRERCLVCNTSDEALVSNIAATKKKIAPNQTFSREMKSYYRSFHKTASMDKEYYEYVCDSDLMTYDSEDSEREITIICNIRCNEVLHIGAHDNERLNKNKIQP
ncbi:uncharacterized protein CXorf66 homolog [Dasypus novemcinctus]|uniref:uncharacterized protein CXorf66 homolog n=1 Tax=Dasypus novemcinctus TaxID=9361 RepID=UPI00265DFDED|nr:uncharacterized protein CXorf66 homolog [Dasypus novemcinctus]